jgi:hypothetical protein
MRLPLVFYSASIYPLWGPLALWLNVRLYGHHLDRNHSWTSRLWTRTPYGRRRYAEKMLRAPSASGARRPAH